MTGKADMFIAGTVSLNRTGNGVVRKAGRGGVNNTVANKVKEGEQCLSKLK